MPIDRFPNLINSAFRSNHMSHHLYELPLLQRIPPININFEPENREEDPSSPRSRLHSLETLSLPEEHISHNDATDSKPLPDAAVICHGGQTSQLHNFDVSTPAHCEHVHAFTWKPKAKRHATLLIEAFVVVTLSIFTVYYAYTVLVSERAVPPAFVLSPGKTVSVVNILSHMVAFLSRDLLENVGEEMRWALACRTKGVLLTTFLALSRATPYSGVAYLCSVRGSHRFWCMQRCVFHPNIVLRLILVDSLSADSFPSHSCLS
jgi:hypothetical protein